MASINKKNTYVAGYTHEGALAVRTSNAHELEKAMLTTMLWEDVFYEKGESVADRIYNLSQSVSAEQVHDIVIRSREDSGLRHAPLMGVLGLLKSGDVNASDLINRITTRPDQMTEILALYWKDGKKPISAQLKKGLAKAFVKFDEYQLAKYNRPNDVKLKDVLFLSHAKPKDEAQASIWKRLINDELAIPDTWETNLSAGKDKAETFGRLISENKLGALAYVRNLRNMHEAGIDRRVILDGLRKVNARRIMPFQLISAAYFNPWAEPVLEELLFKSTRQYAENPLGGKTIILMDTSGSMQCGSISSKNFANYLDAGAALCAVLREVFSDVDIWAFESTTHNLPARRGFGLIEVIKNAPSGGTRLGNAVREMNAKGYDRIIVITDEQSHDNVYTPLSDSKAYMINVANYQKSVGFGKWNRINGWSDSIARYIATMEQV